MNKFIYISDGVEKEISAKEIPSGLKIELKGNSKGNTIRIHAGGKYSNSSIVIDGDENLVIIGENVRLHNTLIQMEYKKNKRCAWIEKNVSVGGMFVSMTGERDYVKIGSNCMLSYDITIRTQDGHTIFDRTTGEVINKGGKVVLGSHVWVGCGCFISKNVEIADNTIIGANSVVTKSFLKEFCSIAGVPAKLIRENVAWDIRDIERFERENKIGEMKDEIGDRNA